MASTVITCYPVYGMDIAENEQVSLTSLVSYVNLVYSPDMHIWMRARSNTELKSVGNHVL